jgi:hypothetical protein
MTALEILKGLKSNPECLLWIDYKRKKAAYHTGEHACVNHVDYETAMLVRPDPSIVMLDAFSSKDGETFAAA